MFKVRPIAIYVCPAHKFFPSSARQMEWIIYSLTVRLGKVYPNFLDKPLSLVYKTKKT